MQAPNGSNVPGEASQRLQPHDQGGRYDAGDPLLSQEKDDQGFTASTNMRQARKISSLKTALETLSDLIILPAALYFIIFGVLVFRQRGHSVDEEVSKALLEASRYGPTIFPIAFAAIVAKALRSIAAFKLEHGCSVLTLESILGSRSVFGVVRTPASLRSISAITPLLIMLWALSPFGGQASLRVISTVSTSTNGTASVSFFNFTSPFTNAGPVSTSAKILSQINSIFIAALITPVKSKAASQDQFGNIKIPMIEYLGHPTDKSGWIDLHEEGYEYSNLLGLPALGIPVSDKTAFTMETQYMFANCSLNHTSYAQYIPPQDQFDVNSTANSFYAINWNGEIFFLRWDTLPSILIGGRPDRNTTFWVDFQSVGGPGQCSWKYLTEAYCGVTYSYVEVAIECQGNRCSSTAIRESQRNHAPSILVPIGGLADPGTLWTYFFPNFIQSTYTEALCDISCCSSSPLEAYLLRPGSPYSISYANPPIWPIGHIAFSQRFSQLLNTYWLASVGPLELLGQFTTGSNATALGRFGIPYGVSNTTATVQHTSTVIHCDIAWLGVLLLASIVMLVVGMVGALLNMTRKGPDILDSFGALLQHEPSVGIKQFSSMEDSQERSRRLKHLRVRLGDIRPEENVGHVAIAPVGHDIPVKKLRSSRHYK